MAPQLLFLGFIAALLVYFVTTASQNMQAAGLTSGFDFLWRSTSWELSFAVLPISSSDPYWYFFLVGILNTLLLGAISLTLATILGLVVGAIRTSGNAMAELIGTTYVEIFRNVPLLLQLVFWYKILLVLPPPRQAIGLGELAFLSNRGTYVPGLNIGGIASTLLILAIVLGIGLTLYLFISRRFDIALARKAQAAIVLWAAIAAAVFFIVMLGREADLPLIDRPELRGLNFRGGISVPPEFLACIIAISIYGSAYIAEIIRAGFNSVDSGITEAGKALGLRSAMLFFLIRLPLAVRAILPTLTNQYVWLFKATTVGIAVGFADFFFVVATAINQSGQTFEIMGIFMAVFLGMNYALAFVLNRVNAAIALKGSQIRGGGREPAPVRIIPRNMEELRRNYFYSPLGALLTVAFGVLFVWLAWTVLDWALLSAIWDPADPAACRDPEVGACWSVLGDRGQLIFFGLYPADEQWRSALGCIVLICVAIMSCMPRFWSARSIVTLWAGGFVTFFILMRGGIFGLTPVAPQEWGGLALTLFIFASVVVIGMPIAIMLALLRRSKLSLISRAVGLLIDVIRSLPLLSILYSAAVILPLALPLWMDTDKLYRVVLAFALFFACYQAEILRSGFQSLPDGQEEAGKSLGLKYKERIFLIMLPQVFRMSLPPTINQVVITFKETSLVVIIGFFEILASGSAAFGTADWSVTFVEVYVFIALIYFIFTSALSRYGAYLERRNRLA